jgi:hypothetical protein
MPDIGLRFQNLTETEQSRRKNRGWTRMDADFSSAPPGLTKSASSLTTLGSNVQSR